MKQRPISLSTKLFVDANGQLTKLESPFQHWYKKINVARVGIVVYVALTVGVSMYPLYMYFLQRTGLFLQSPIGLRIGIYLALVSKFCQLFFFCLHQVTKKIDLEEFKIYKKQQKHYGNTR